MEFIEDLTFDRSKDLVYEVGKYYSQSDGVCIWQVLSIDLLKSKMLVNVVKTSSDSFYIGLGQHFFDIIKMSFSIKRYDCVSN